MDIETVRRLSLARHLYGIGVSNLRSKNDLHLFSAVNLLQDSVEAFLIAIADHVGAKVASNIGFEKYFDLIDTKIAPKELPFKLALLKLNRIRVDSKHYGIQPARDECDRLSVAIHEFFEEVSATHLGANFSTVSAIDLLQDGETKTMLFEAKASLESGDHEGCAISCRKAIFLEIEHNYDIYHCKEDKPFGFFSWPTKAPTFARNKDYIEKNVREPTDYIVYDHSDLNQELLTQGVDNTAFWNVWRLTPEVYKNKDGKWIVKYDFAKLDGNVLRDKIEYIFSTTVDIVLSIHSTRSASKYIDHQSYNLELKQENVPVFEKADKSSKIISMTPPGMLKIDTEFRVEGLQGDGLYWYISHMEVHSFLYGFIHNDYVK